jgi:hypothetical protein
LKQNYELILKNQREMKGVTINCPNHYQFSPAVILPNGEIWCEKCLKIINSKGEINMGPATIEENLHELRVEISKVIEFTDMVASLIERGAGGRELSLVKTKLQEAKMWAGLSLGERGSKLPEQFRDDAPVPAQQA